MIYLFAIFLLLLSGVKSNDAVTKVCVNTNGGERTLDVASMLVDSILEQFPGSYLGECTGSNGGGNGGGVLQQVPGNPRRYVAQVAPKNAIHVPKDTETVYMCTVFDAYTFDKPMWIDEVNIQTVANQKVIHHGVTYAIEEDTPFYDNGPYTGCDRDADGNIVDYSSCVRGAGSHFGHGDVIPDCFETRNLSPRAQVVFAFQRGNPDFKAPEGRGIRVGPGTKYRWLLFQAHYHNMASNENAEVVDASRMTIKLTTEPKINLGVMLFGNFPHENLFLPGGRNSVKVRVEIPPTGAGYPKTSLGESEHSYFPKSGAYRVGVFEHLYSKANFAEIVQNGGIDIHVSAIHFHGMGTAMSKIMRFNTTSNEYDALPLDTYWQSGHSMDMDMEMRSGSMDMGMEDGSVVGNFHAFVPPKKLAVRPRTDGVPYPPYLVDGLDLLTDFNTSMKDHPTTGGYSTHQEMDYDYTAYSPAPTYQPTIYAFAPCRTCNDFEGSFHDYMPMDMGGMGARNDWGQPITLKDLNGNDYTCHPGAVQQYIRHSPECAA